MSDMTMNEIQAAVWALAEKNGFHTPGTNDTIGHQIANIHAEVSEAWEEFRKPDFDPNRIYYRADGKPEGFGMELADVMIRCMDALEAVGLSAQALILEKHEYNLRRPYRHGGKRA